MQIPSNFWDNLHDSVTNGLVITLVYRSEYYRFEDAFHFFIVYFNVCPKQFEADNK